MICPRQNSAGPPSLRARALASLAMRGRHADMSQCRGLRDVQPRRGLSADEWKQSIRIEDPFEVSPCSNLIYFAKVAPPSLVKFQLELLSDIDAEISNQSLIFIERCFKTTLDRRSIKVLSHVFFS